MFHYTSQAGLLGIISSNHLWATNFRYLNDSSEFAYGLSIAHDYLDQLSSVGQEEIVTEFLKRARKLLDLSALTSGKDFYAGCFCERSDLLSQWRAYADHGGGYAIGFDAHELAKAVIGQSMALFPVEYGRGPNAKLLEDDVSAICRALSICTKQTPGNDEAFLNAAYEDLRVAYSVRLFWFKHPGFAEEQEWRILANFKTKDLSRVKFRQGQQNPLPYVELTSFPGGPERLPIKQVMHGPGAHPDLASQSVEWLLKKNGLKDVDIRHSAIPLRP